MFQYVVGYSSPEDTWRWHFWHEIQYTDEEMASFVEDALFVALKAERVTDPQFYDLMDSAAFKDKMNELGFFEKAVEARFVTCAWASATDPVDWNDWSDDASRELSARLGARLEEHE